VRDHNEPARIHYFIEEEERHDPNEAHTISVLGQNEPEWLGARMGGSGGAGYNIESLTAPRPRGQKHSPASHRHHGHADG